MRNWEQMDNLLALMNGFYPQRSLMAYGKGVSGNMVLTFGYNAVVILKQFYSVLLNPFFVV